MAPRWPLRVPSIRAARERLRARVARDRRFVGTDVLFGVLAILAAIAASAWWDAARDKPAHDDIIVGVRFAGPNSGGMFSGMTRGYSHVDAAPGVAAIASDRELFVLKLDDKGRDLGSRFLKHPRF
jgi:hypothetical protein